MSEKNIPFRIKISDVKCGRYKVGTKPPSWDLRKAGTDVVVSTEGEEYILDCQGDQSTPDLGWELLINAKTEIGYAWTLFGVAKK